MILSATNTIEMWGAKRRQLVDGIGDELDAILLPRWQAGSDNKKDWVHENSLLFPRLLPFIFVLVWGILLWFGVVNPDCLDIGQRGEK